MPASTLRALRFVRTWLAGSRAPIEEREVEIPGEGRRIPGTLFSSRRTVAHAEAEGDAPVLPRGSGRSGWIVLHGVTRPGRRHAQLVRFCRALAYAAGPVIVPEIPEWRELRLAPDVTVPTVRAAVDRLGGDGAGLVGFSFGAPQALRAAADRELRTRISGVVGFGGYFDVHRTVRFQLTGYHEWKGVERRLVPDPYGRWIMAANHLTDVPGHEDADDVARALRELAAIAGDARIPSDAPEMAAPLRELRESVAPPRRPLYDLLAEGPGEEGTGDPGGTRESRLEGMADELSRAALTMEPLLEVGEALRGIRCPVELIHGRSDRLVPYTESLRLAAAFPETTRVRVTITDLFAHTEGRSVVPSISGIREGWRFFAALRRVMGLA